jgi:hypothetical protein
LLGGSTANVDTGSANSRRSDKLGFDLSGNIDESCVDVGAEFSTGFDESDTLLKEII